MDDEGSLAQSVLFLREWLGEEGVGGGGPGVAFASVGVAGAEGVVEAEEEDDDEASASQESAGAGFGGLLAEVDDIERFLKEDSRLALELRALVAIFVKSVSMRLPF